MLPSRKLLDFRSQLPSQYESDLSVHQTGHYLWQTRTDRDSSFKRAMIPLAECESFRRKRVARRKSTIKYLPRPFGHYYHS